MAENDAAPPKVDAPAPVPYDRFQSVVAEKNTLSTENATLKGEIQKLSEKAATVDTLTGQINEWKGKAEAAGKRFATFTQLSGALGTTDTDVIDSFDSKYQALPEKDRPDRKAWVESLKAKPEDAPAILRPWLTPATTTAAPPKTAPKVPGTQATPPNAPNAPDAAEIRAAREKGVRTGDWADWKAVSVRLGIRPAAKG